MVNVNFHILADIVIRIIPASLVIGMLTVKRPRINQFLVARLQGLMDQRDAMNAAMETMSAERKTCETPR